MIAAALEAAPGGMLNAVASEAAEDPRTKTCRTPPRKHDFIERLGNNDACRWQRTCCVQVVLASKSIVSSFAVSLSAHPPQRFIKPGRTHWMRTNNLPAQKAPPNSLTCVCAPCLCDSNTAGP